jgi:transaldolase
VHIIQSSLVGCHVATMPFKVMEMLFKHPLTDIGLDKFLADVRKLQAELEAKRARV